MYKKRTVPLADHQNILRNRCPLLSLTHSRYKSKDNRSTANSSVMLSWSRNHINCIHFLLKNCVYMGQHEGHRNIQIIIKYSRICASFYLRPIHENWDSIIPTDENSHLLFLRSNSSSKSLTEMWFWQFVWTKVSLQTVLSATW